MVHRRFKRPAKRKNRPDDVPAPDLRLPKAERIALKKRAAELSSRADRVAVAGAAGVPAAGRPHPDLRRDRSIR